MKQMESERLNAKSRMQKFLEAVSHTSTAKETGRDQENTEQSNRSDDNNELRRSKSFDGSRMHFNNT